MIVKNNKILSVEELELLKRGSVIFRVGIKDKMNEWVLFRFVRYYVEDSEICEPRVNVMTVNGEQTYYLNEHNFYNKL